MSFLNIPSDLAVLFAPEYNHKKLFQHKLAQMNRTSSNKVCWVGDSIIEQGKPSVGNGIGFTTYIENLYPNITFINEGIGGNTTLDIIARLSTITAHNANMYVLAIGVNDARYNDSRGAITQAAYMANITTIVNVLLAGGAQVTIISIWPTFYMDQFASLKRFATDQRMVEWNMALCNYADLAGCIYIDTYTPIKKYITFFNVDYFTTDGVHPICTDIPGKKLYAATVLNDVIPKGQFGPEYTYNASASSTHYYKLVCNNPDASNARGTGGYLGIQNIAILPYYKEVLAKTGNTSYNSSHLFGSYTPSPTYLGFYNIANDYPMTIYIACDQVPASIATTGIVGGVSNAYRGIRNYDLYFSDDRDAFGDESHPSWRMIYSESKTDAIAVNLLPKVRTNVFYKLSVTTFGNSQTTLKLKQIFGALPIRVFYQNALSTTVHRYPVLFSATGIATEADSLQSIVLPFTLCWESEEPLSSIILASFNASLGAFAISKSYISADIALPSSTTWTQIANGTGDQTVTF